ncbi:hypothetical protein MCGE09_00038 [Thaumarchaeota archaeon SCGC AB-539-E09]|nr:hypothetical protein MCGE09_00038 [Thaumarchaeota archaeon SCGC AB-539-E09]
MKSWSEMSFLLYIMKLLLFLSIIYIPQQIIHEIGHAIACQALGGKVLKHYFSLKGAFITCELPRNTIILTTFRFSGGLFAFAVLYLIFTRLEYFSIEIKTITLTYSYGNLFLAFLEGGFYDFYSLHLSLSNLLILPAFFIAVYTLKNEYYKATKKNVDNIGK